MSNAIAWRRSPFADAWATAQPQCISLAQMQVPDSFSVSQALPVMLADLSFLPRVGFKGAEAAAWLSAQRLPLPAQHNRWLGHRGGVIARLGMTEYFLESSADDDWTEPLRMADGASIPAVPVLRQDASLLLCGERVHELLLQVCSYHFAALDVASQEAVMTQMLGVSVLMIAIAPQPLPVYRLWCDPSFATYLWHHLLEIAAELGGGAVGWQQLQDFDLPYASRESTQSGVKP